MTIDQRMELLERTIRRLEQGQGGLLLWGLIFAIAVLVITVVVIGVLKMNKGELVLRKLVIKDMHGRTRIEMSTSEDIARIRHFDAKGKIRISSSTSPDGGAGIYHSDANGEPRISSATMPNGKAVSIWWNYDANGEMEVVKSLP